MTQTSTPTSSATREASLTITHYERIVLKDVRISKERKNCRHHREKSIRSTRMRRCCINVMFLVDGLVHRRVDKSLFRAYLRSRTKCLVGIVALAFVFNTLTRDHTFSTTSSPYIKSIVIAAASSAHAISLRHQHPFPPARSTSSSNVDPSDLPSPSVQTLRLR